MTRESFYPDWEDMPTPKRGLRLSWQYIYWMVYDPCLTRLGRKPQKHEISEIFCNIMDVSEGAEETLHDIVRFQCEIYYEELAKSNRVESG